MHDITRKRICALLEKEGECDGQTDGHTDRQTDTYTIAKTRFTLDAVVRKKPLFAILLVFRSCVCQA